MPALKKILRPNPDVVEKLRVLTRRYGRKVTWKEWQAEFGGNETNARVATALQESPLWENNHVDIFRVYRPDMERYIHDRRKQGAKLHTICAELDINLCVVLASGKKTGVVDSYTPRKYPTCIDCGDTVRDGVKRCMACYKKIRRDKSRKKYKERMENPIIARRYNGRRRRGSAVTGEDEEDAGG
jgi:hypothetical protein